MNPRLSRGWGSGSVFGMRSPDGHGRDGLAAPRVRRLELAERDLAPLVAAETERVQAESSAASSNGTRRPRDAAEPVPRLLRHPNTQVGTSLPQLTHRDGVTYLYRATLSPTISDYDEQLADWLSELAVSPGPSTRVPTRPSWNSACIPESGPPGRD